MAMRLEPLGDSAYILRELQAPPYAIANHLNHFRPPGLIEAVASYETIGLFVDPDQFDPSTLQIPADLASTPPTHHLIPVCYELGEDGDAVAETLNVSRETLVSLHAAHEYKCFAVGFCPGFAYLGYLPPQLQGVPRRGSPRTLVEPGSVAITGSQTSVYPLPKPGGWSLIGRTPLCLVDVADDYFPIAAGDSVRFTPITQSEYEARLGERL